MKKMKVKKISYFSLFVFLVVVGIYFYSNTNSLNFMGGITGSATGIIEETAPDTDIYFSSQTDLDELFSEFVLGTEKNLDCAIYDIGEDAERDFAEKSKQKEVEIRIIKDDETRKIDLPFVKDDRGLMHNKFCIRDNSIVWTGSYNPTQKGTLNNNNVIILYSKYAVDNYNEEFEEMWNSIFKKGDRVKYPQVKINGKLYEFYFCPEDNCEDQTIEELEKAKESIYSMTFSFTSERISDVLKKKANEGVKVSLLFEAQRKNMQYEKYSELKDVVTSYLDTDKMGDYSSGTTENSNRKDIIMHHKVFVIDRNTVVTGSYNPTGGGDKRNDENVVIIHDSEIAKKYIEEFERLTK